MRRWSNWLRKATRFGAALAIGVLVTIAVAWFTSYQSIAPNSISRATGVVAVDDALITVEVERFGALGYECAIEAAIRSVRADQSTSSLPIDAYPRWDDPARMSEIVRTQWHAVTPMSSHTRFALACGWPMLAMHGDRGNLTTDSGALREIQSRSCWIVDLTKYPRLGLARNWVIIPLHPVWPGFLVDVLFFGSLAAIPIFAVPPVRRRNRRRRGLCEACGYGPLVSGACAECGAAASWRRVDGDLRTLQPAEP